MADHLITVSFCCNDEHGHFAGKVAAIEIHGLDGSDISLESRTMEGNRFRYIQVRRHQHRLEGFVKVGRRSFRARGYTTGYGNWCWDAVRMTLEGVHALALHLRDLGWRIDEADVDFCDLWNSGATITPQHINHALCSMDDVPDRVLIGPAHDPRQISLFEARRCWRG